MKRFLAVVMILGSLSSFAGEEKCVSTITNLATASYQLGIATEQLNRAEEALRNGEDNMAVLEADVTVKKANVNTQKVLVQINATTLGIDCMNLNMLKIQSEINKKVNEALNKAD